MKICRTKHILVIVVFVIAAVICAYMSSGVSINYNLSDYLAEDTETKISLEIIDHEFGNACDVQVMIDGITAEEAKNTAKTLSNIVGVLNVSFDAASENSYHDNRALFVVLVEGDEYSESANNTASAIQDMLYETYGTSLSFGGAVVEKSIMRDNIQGEMMYIIVISVALAALIMLFTSKSWLEPLFLLATSGIAILLNMGTNLIFGEISYITNAVAAILQLALSVDYSIVLLHKYRAEKETESDHERAMRTAVKAVIRPVAASALTTLAGLLALLFMSFGIGFDIGSVLMKGIILSAVVAMTLLPAVLLLADGLMEKTQKKELVLRGGIFCSMAQKACAVIVPIAVLLIAAGGFLQTKNTYAFTDTDMGNSEIKDSFGRSNSIIVVYENSNDQVAKETALIDWLNAYPSEDGSELVKSVNAYSNTVREPFDLQKAAEKLNMSKEDVEMLFAMYGIYKNPESVELDARTFVEYADWLSDNDESIADIMDDNTRRLIDLILTVDALMNGTHFAEDFHTLATTGVMEGSGLPLFSVQQMYGLYHYNKLEASAADLQTMLTFILEAAQKPELAGMFDAESAAGLKALSDGIVQFNAQMGMPMTKAQFQGYMYQNYGMVISDMQTAQIYGGYFQALGAQPLETISFINLMTFMADTQMLTDPTAVATLQSYRALYNAIQTPYTYDAFLPALAQIAQGLTGQPAVFSVTAESIQQMYILFFRQNGLIPAEAIPGSVFVDFIRTASAANPIIASQISPDVVLKLEDMIRVNTLLSDTQSYTYSDISARFEALRTEMQSVTAEGTLNSEKLSGVYIKYAIENDLLPVNTIIACDLLDFVTEHMDNNVLLKTRMNDEKREKVADAHDAINRANELFLGETYARMLLSVNLPNESKQTSAFVTDLSVKVKEVFGQNAYIAGQTVSTNDLRNAFDYDNKLISIITVVSIFVIVAVIFRSMSLPVILVAIIQGAIWIALSTSLLTGSIFFMSYIVATCILMGATIDYGILMSSNYVNYRAEHDKKEALRLSVAAAMPTVFTSGVILTLCGFVISFIASQNSIATVGSLLGRGTLVSVLMITVVLPSVLYLLDAFVMKLTVKKK